MKQAMIVSISGRDVGHIADLELHYTMQEHSDSAFIADGKAWAKAHGVAANHVIVSAHPLPNAKLQAAMEARHPGVPVWQQIYNPMHSKFQGYQKCEVMGRQILFKTLNATGGVVFAEVNSVWVEELALQEAACA